jgi:anti-sigma28 factor (negative regulator of flagellin synthesis)
VEISEEARSRAAKLEGEQPTTAAPAEKPSIDEIRQRIRDGVYETDHAIDSIARRILERGDI